MHLPVAWTYTTERHPGTLFSGTWSAASMGASFFAKKSSCWYLRAANAASARYVHTAAHAHAAHRSF